MSQQLACTVADCVAANLVRRLARGDNGQKCACQVLVEGGETRTSNPWLHDDRPSRFRRGASVFAALPSAPSPPHPPLTPPPLEASHLNRHTGLKSVRHFPSSPAGCVNNARVAKEGSAIGLGSGGGRRGNDHQKAWQPKTGATTVRRSSESSFESSQ